MRPNHGTKVEGKACQDELTQAVQLQVRHCSKIVVMARDAVSPAQPYGSAPDITVLLVAWSNLPQDLGQPNSSGDLARVSQEWFALVHSLSRNVLTVHPPGVALQVAVM